MAKRSRRRRTSDDQDARRATAAEQGGCEPPAMRCGRIVSVLRNASAPPPEIAAGRQVLLARPPRFTTASERRWYGKPEYSFLRRPP